MLLRMCLRSPGMLIGATIMAVSLRPKLSLVFAVTVPLMLICILMVIRTAFPRFAKMQEKVDGLWLTVANLNDTLNTMPGEYVLKVIYEYMRFSMRIKKPNLNADYCKMKTQIEDANIKLKRIV